MATVWFRHPNAAAAAAAATLRPATRRKERATSIYKARIVRYLNFFKNTHTHFFKVYQSGGTTPLLLLLLGFPNKIKPDKRPRKECSNSAVLKLFEDRRRRRRKFLNFSRAIWLVCVKGIERRAATLSAHSAGPNDDMHTHTQQQQHRDDKEREMRLLLLLLYYYSVFNCRAFSHRFSVQTVTSFWCPAAAA